MLWISMWYIIYCTKIRTAQKVVIKCVKNDLFFQLQTLGTTKIYLERWTDIFIVPFYPLTQFLLCFHTSPELLETFFVCKSKSHPDPTFERWGIQFKIWGIFHISIWISHIIKHFIYWIHLNRLKYIYAQSATHLNTNIFFCLLYHRHQQ